jgi:hypothetical protein
VDLAAGRARARIVRLGYDWRAQAAALRQAGLPEEFAWTCETGWWTTCLEILPAAERSRGAFHIYDSSVPDLLAGLGLPLASWPDPCPQRPARPLWGSPLLPNRIWYDSKAAGMEELARTAAADGITLAEISAFAPARPVSRAPQPLLLPELTVTSSGWFCHPLRTGPRPLLPAAEGVSPAQQLTAAQQAVTQYLLDGLQERGLLAAPRYCAA